MGIRGLQSYIEKNHPHCLDSVYILQSAEEYRRKTGVAPVLLVDGYSCSSHLYNFIKNDNKHLGVFLEYAELISVFIDQLVKGGIRVIIYFDGSPTEDREKLWIERRCKEGTEIEEAMNFLSRRQLSDAKTILTDKLCKGEVLKFTCVLKKCEVMQTVEEADDEILDFIANNGCFGVLAQDTDFIITEGITNYFSAQHLDPIRLTTKAYNRLKISRMLGIDEHFLPIFATLSGNDKLSDEQLRNFHIWLLRDHHDYCRLLRARYLPKREIFPRIGRLIQRLSPYINNLQNCSSVLCNEIGMSHLESTIKQSILSYVPSTIKKEICVEPVLSINWKNIVSLAEDRHRDGVHRSILAVITRFKFHQSCTVEMFHNSSLPSSGVLLRKLRSMMYGILLKEHPTNHHTVKEYVVTTRNSVSTPVHVNANFPSIHPGLLHLWGSSATQEEKLKMLCWAISEKLNVSKVLNVPEPFRIACLALYYLINEVESGFIRWHVEALLSSLVCLFRPSFAELCRPQSVCPDAIEVHIGSVFTRTWFSVLMVDECCGQSIDTQQTPVFFDGPLFNYFFHLKFKGIEDSSNKFSEHASYNKMLRFIYDEE